MIEIAIDEERCQERMGSLQCIRKKDHPRPGCIFISTAVEEGRHV